MKILQFDILRKNVYYVLLVSLTIAILISCRKSDGADNQKKPVISYQQKNISVAEDVAMTPVRPDSTGGAITAFSISPSLPKGFILNKSNGEISGTPSDTLTPTKFVVMATGPGGIGTDTLMLSVGTVGFNYGSTSTFTLEKGSTDLSTTPISPVVLAGTFNQYFVSPSPDSLTIKTGLRFNSQTGQISGTPTVLTSTTEVPKPVVFTITGISTGNKAASTVISFIINDIKPVFVYTYTGSFTVGTSVGNTLLPTKLVTSGNILKYRLAPTSPALPDGLTLDSLTGKIQGIPTAASNATVIIRGINTGGFLDVNLPLIVNATAIAPEVYYTMSLFSGNLIDTIAPRIYSGNTIYLTKNDNIGGVAMNLNPVVTAGQIGTFTIAPSFATGLTGENLFLTAGSGLVSGTPGQFTANSNPSHTLNISNATTGGPAGSFAMNIVANAPFYTYNSTGKGSTLNNIYFFVQNQKLDVSNGTYPGYTSTELSPVNGAGVVSYTIYPSTAASPAFANTGLTFNTTTGVISGTPSTTSKSFSTTSFWDYVIVGKKADGSFTVYKIRMKIYASLAEWAGV